MMYENADISTKQVCMVPTFNCNSKNLLLSLNQVANDNNVSNQFRKQSLTP